LGLGGMRNSCRTSGKILYYNNIKTDIKETGYDDMGWINLAKDRRVIVNTIMKLRDI
jgi:hypothetical protein